MTVWCRWLGVAGVELSAGAQTLVIDPYFTRFPLWRMLAGPVHPDRQRIIENIQRCEHILVTHPHFDHVMDVPTVALHTGAIVLGSSNTCQIVRESGVLAEQVCQIEVGDRLDLGEFQVNVLRAQHGETTIDHLINGPMPADFKLPLRPVNYRMDECFSFMVEVGGIRLLIDHGETRGEDVLADVLFVGTVALTAEPQRYYELLLERVRPKIVIPYHWDDSFRPLSRPIWPSFEPPKWAIPPLRRCDLAGARQVIEQIAPETKVIIPEIFHSYNLDELL